MRVPTYSNYTNMSNAIKQNRELVDKYSFQAGTGLKHQNYSIIIHQRLVGQVLLFPRLQHLHLDQQKDRMMF